VTTGRRNAALAAGLALLAAASAPGEECLIAWRVAGVDGTRATCRDGDPACDLDGAADRSCTFGVALCLRVAGCAPGTVPAVRIQGAGAATLQAAVAALGAPPVASALCTAERPVSVRAGRRAAVRAWARDPASRRRDRDRLRLTCARPARSARGRAVVITTDFETGLLATVGVRRPHPVGHPETPIHADAVVRVAGDRVFVVNRFLGDNLQVLDPADGLATVLQCSTGPGSNPHDVAVATPHKAYVTRYDEKELWVVDPGAASCSGFRQGTINLAPFGDADGLPEMGQMALVGERLFVSLERLDRSRNFAPSGRSLLVAIDTVTDTVTGTVELSGSNAFGDSSGLAREPGTGKLLVAEAGDLFRTGDGGIERVDPVALAAEGFLITEAELGGSITDFVLVNATKGYAIVLDERLRNLLVAFDPTAHVVTRRLLVRTEYLPDIALAPDGTLWLADDGLPAPGIRIFDTLEDRELTRRVIDVGLPPFAIGFIP
jgi:DNA-binding beta-propeller fold protein YncE